jgi:hypothetical protein
MKARLGPHDSPGDAKRRPVTRTFDFVPFATASLLLGLLGRRASSP